MRARVVRALEDGDACWCSMVKLEWWNGAAGERDHKVLCEFETVLPELLIDEAVWMLASNLARRTRAKGFTAATHCQRIGCWSIVQLPPAL